MGGNGDRVQQRRQTPKESVQFGRGRPRSTAQRGVHGHLAPHQDRGGSVAQGPDQGEAANALRAWLDHSKLESGAVIRGIKANGTLGKRIRPWDIARMMKLRAATASEKTDDLSGHSIWSGFITEAGRRGIPLLTAMELSGHKSVATAAIYHRPGATRINPASNILHQERLNSPLA
ncbi:MAG TPA: hypothetical protein VF493_23655 [Terriglobales bacterium]